MKKSDLCEKHGVQRPAKLTSADHMLKHRYGMTREQYDELLAKQGGACAICRATEDLVVDHDHDTGKVCGILCRKCNVGLGQFNDDGRLIEIACMYALATRS
jgi:hypothetical protein